MLSLQMKPSLFDSYCSDRIEDCNFFSSHKNEKFVMGKLDLSASHGLPAYFYILPLMASCLSLHYHRPVPLKLQL